MKYKLRIGCAVSAAALLLGCSNGPAAEACREFVELNLVAPSTITEFETKVSSKLLGSKFWIEMDSPQCEKIGWPIAICEVVTAKLNFLSMEPNNIQKQMEINENEKVAVVEKLPEYQREVNIVLVEFDASNSFGTPIRHEARCVFVADREGDSTPLSDAMLDFQTYRGFGS